MHSIGRFESCCSPEVGSLLPDGHSYRNEPHLTGAKKRTKEIFEHGVTLPQRFDERFQPDEFTADDLELAGLSL